MALTVTPELIEALAAIEHERWADWQRYLHSRCVHPKDGTIIVTPEASYSYPLAFGSLIIPAPDVEHWERQIATPYEALTEREKESDREQVRRYLPLLEAIP